VQPTIPKFYGHYDHLAKLMENFLLSKEYWHLVENGIEYVSHKVNATKVEIELMEEQKLSMCEYYELLLSSNWYRNFSYYS